MLNPTSDLGDLVNTRNAGNWRHYIPYKLANNKVIMLSFVQINIAKLLILDLPLNIITERIKCRKYYINELLHGKRKPKEFKLVVEDMRKYQVEHALATLYTDLPDQLEKAKAQGPLEWLKCIQIVRQVYPFIKNLNPNAPKSKEVDKNLPKPDDATKEKLDKANAIVSSFAK